MDAYLRPYPNTNSAGSQTSGFSLPSRRNLSGRKRSGSGYRSGSCRHALHHELVIRLSKARRGVSGVSSYQEFGSRTVPAEIKYPSHSVSTLVMCGMLKGSTGAQRKTSL